MIFAQQVREVHLGGLDVFVLLALSVAVLVCIGCASDAAGKRNGIGVLWFGFLLILAMGAMVLHLYVLAMGATRG